MQKIIFGLSLDATSFHDKEGIYFFGQMEFMRWLELQLGLAWPAKNYSWLRTAFFRKVLKAFLESRPDAFFSASFDADSYGTTKAVLALRDELLLSKWDFSAPAASLKRLKDMSELERFLQGYLAEGVDGRVLHNSFAERFLEVEAALEPGYLPFLELTLVEPVSLLPVWWQRLVGVLQDVGVHVSENRPEIHQNPNSDLHKVAQMLVNQSFKGNKLSLVGDKSLVVLRVARDYDGLETYAFGANKRGEKLPFVVMPPDLKLPDLVFESDGLPVSGNTSVSDLRPSQQLIKLAHTFLWRPIDLGKVLEFLNLPYSPLHSHLAVRLASALQDRPGFDSEAWHRAIQSFSDSENVEESEKEAALFEYNFWFGRKTYFQKTKIPKSEVFSIYLHLVKWAKSHLASPSSGAIYMSIYRLSLDMLDLLDAIDEQVISILDLDKLTEIVIQATPATFKDREVGASDFAQDPGAVVFPTKELIWFNFVSSGSDYVAPQFTRSEIHYLQAQGVELTLPADQNKLRKWKRYQPLVLAEKRVILVVPDKVEGVYADLHPLHYELAAMIKNMGVVTIDIRQNPKNLEGLLAIRPASDVLPKASFLEGHLLRISPIQVPENLTHFSVTELETFLFYPHYWVLRKQMQLYGSSLSKIKDVQALMGNIAHKIFELLLSNKLHLADNEEISEWFFGSFQALIEAEGLPFLEYGKEPDLLAFRKKLYFSLLSFVYALRQNNWKVVATEETLRGQLGKNPVKGITDVVLERDGQYLIVDLKWGGKTFRKDMLKSKEDIQLMLYSKYFGEETTWWDACFYIIRDGVFVTRTSGLFDASDLVLSKEAFGEIYEEMMERLVRTLDWRMSQLSKGELELRTKDTVADLDEYYGEQIFDFLPLKNEGYRFDDYGALLGGVE
ncbi:MAG TPA: hypothetical protein ENK85_02255 [Saprospiraceae bacterium]|nr:hypothetical protein [Saprospiraceae bacterium]